MLCADFKLSHGPGPCHFAVGQKFKAFSEKQKLRRSSKVTYIKLFLPRLVEKMFVDARFQHKP